MGGFFKKIASGAKKLFGKVKQGVSDTFKNKEVDIQNSDSSEKGE